MKVKIRNARDFKNFIQNKKIKIVLILCNIIDNIYNIMYITIILYIF